MGKGHKSSSFPVNELFEHPLNGKSSVAGWKLAGTSPSLPEGGGGGVPQCPAYLEGEWEHIWHICPQDLLGVLEGFWGSWGQKKTPWVDEKTKIQKTPSIFNCDVIYMNQETKKVHAHIVSFFLLWKNAIYSIPVPLSIGFGFGGRINKRTGWDCLLLYGYRSCWPLTPLLYFQTGIDLNVT